MGEGANNSALVSCQVRKSCCNIWYCPGLEIDLVGTYLDGNFLCVHAYVCMCMDACICIFKRQVGTRKLNSSSIKASLLKNILSLIFWKESHLTMLRVYSWLYTLELLLVVLKETYKMWEVKPRLTGCKTSVQCTVLSLQPFIFFASPHFVFNMNIIDIYLFQASNMLL